VLLPEIDEEIVEILQRELKKNHIEVITGARPVRIGGGPDGETEIEIETKGEAVKLAASCVVRTERRPNTDGLRLEAIGVRLNERGGIATSPMMETSVNSVFAAGDVTMNHLCTPVAYAEGLTAAENAAGNTARMNYSAVPHWAGSIPPISGTGMTEKEALRKGHTVRVGRFPMAANGMATILGRRVGMVKVIVDATYEEILGVHMVGPNAPELINEVLLAMKNELTPKEVAATFHVHPSLAEALWDSMRSVYGESINSFSPVA
jgi:dihydrolipoamide dehydrogenase